MQNQIILEANRLGMIRSDNVIFRNINFTIRSGNNLLVIGRNGSGKSTLLKIIAGITSASEGQFMINQQKHLYRTQIGDYIHYLTDFEHFKPELTTYQNLIHYSYLLHPYLSERFHHLNCIQGLTLMNLEPYKNLPTKYLSFGQTKRLSLVRLFLKEKKIWILDEPTVGLDNKSVQLLSFFIQKHNDRGGIVVISSHNNIFLEKVSILELD